jgi:flagellar basal body P-ring protein FlgI
LRLSLRNPDFTIAPRVAQAINRYIGERAATVQLLRPASYAIPRSASLRLIKRASRRPSPC